MSGITFACALAVVIAFVTLAAILSGDTHEG